MESKELRKWQNEQALRRFTMISPLLDEDIDEAKRRQLREEIAEKEGISTRTLSVHGNQSIKLVFPVLFFITIESSC